jgi:hypothetical protein
VIVLEIRRAFVMPLQNRVTPEGDIVAVAARGEMMGNRGGCFHRDDRTLSPRRWASRQWICCVLEFNKRRRQVMQPGRYTELFFLDEVTALSAGHRPCFECRRTDALRFAECLAAAGGVSARMSAPEIDRVLHTERTDTRGAKRVYSCPIENLPDGAFVRLEGLPHVISGADVLHWTPEGYRRRLSTGNPRLKCRPARTRAITTEPVSALDAEQHIQL